VRRHTFADGAVIFREGEVSDAAYLLVSGVVKIVMHFGTAQEKTIALVGKGEYFGEMGAIDSSPRSATAVAKGEVDCAAVSPEEFMDTLTTQPTEAIELLKVLFERLRRADRRIR
jgi:CRP/FNR family transcriptional regulator, cyclic AMP receptor protein